MKNIAGGEQKRISWNSEEQNWEYEFKPSHISQQEVQK